MKTEDVRKILVILALEEADNEGNVVSAQDKRDAASIAGAPLDQQSTAADQNAFLLTRADTLLSRIVSRFPAVSRWIEPPASDHRIGLLILVLGVFAALVGFLSNELGPDKRINILSFPLLGIILWSFAIYLRETVLYFRRNPTLTDGGWIDRIIGSLQSRTRVGEGETETTLQKAQILFEKNWRTLIAPVHIARLKSALHTAAFILAASAIAGMYVKGLANEYRAVWESTFFTDGSQLRPFLQVILGPAAALSGDTLPDVTELNTMHWQAGADEAPGENAARWIHWYALTVGLFVLIPRAFLALMWKIRSLHLAQNLPFRSVSPRFFEGILSTSTGSTFTVHLVPYAINPDESKKWTLVQRLEEHFGRAIAIIQAPTVAFGDEDDFSIKPGEETTELLPLFNFAATPEIETHLAVYRTLSSQALNPIRFILLDTTAFDQKSVSFADSQDRRKGRELAWKALFQSEPVELILFSNATESPTLT